MAPASLASGVSSEVQFVSVESMPVVARAFDVQIVEIFLEWQENVHL